MFGSARLGGPRQVSYTGISKNDNFLKWPPGAPLAVPWTAPIDPPPASGDPPGLPGSVAGHPVVGVPPLGLAGGPQGHACLPVVEPPTRACREPPRAEKREKYDFFKFFKKPNLFRGLFPASWEHPGGLRRSRASPRRPAVLQTSGATRGNIFKKLTF